MKHLLGILTALVIGFTAFSASANDGYTNEYAAQEYHNGYVQYCHYYTDMYGRSYKQCSVSRSHIPEYLLGSILGHTLDGIFNNRHSYGSRHYGSRHYGSRHYGSRHRYNRGHNRRHDGARGHNRRHDGARGHNRRHDGAKNHNRRGGNDNHRRGNKQKHR